MTDIKLIQGNFKDSQYSMNINEPFGKRFLIINVV